MVDLEDVVVTVVKHLPGRHNQRLHARHSHVVSHEDLASEQYRRIRANYRVVDASEDTSNTKQARHYLSNSAKLILFKFYEPWVESLSETQRNALGNYTVCGEEINEELRDRNKYPELTYEATHVYDMDSALNSAKAPFDMLVTRSVGMGWVASSVGETWIDKGYTSTSMSLRHKELPQSTKGLDAPNLTIQVRKGQRIASLGPIVSQEAPEYFSRHPEDLPSEMLIPRNSAFKVIGKNNESSLIVDYLGQATPAPIKSTVITPEFLDELFKNYKLNWENQSHGIPHWEGVRQTGLRLARHAGADTKVVELFAYMHDAFRQNEMEDDERHGTEAADNVDKYNHKFFELSDSQAGQLKRALARHSEYGLIDDDVTVQTCIDADRLSLARMIGVDSLDDSFLHLPISKDRRTKLFALRNASEAMPKVKYVIQN